MANEMNMDEYDTDGIIIYTPEEMLKQGLLFAGYKERSIRRCQEKTNVERFFLRYGACPVVCCTIWEDLQRTDIPEAKVPVERRNLEYFLHAFHFLRHYETEHERAANTGWCRDTCRDWGWYYVDKIQALQAEKIKWPDEIKNAIWISTTDGVHCWFREQSHPEWSINTEYYSHKYNKAGLSYELGISISECRLIWMKGPFPAGWSDRKIFKECGLRDKLRQLGQKTIADGGYHAEEDFDVLSTPNNMDSDVVKKFKRRALKRHEKFNGLMKVFECLDVRHRHDEAKFKLCFEAVAVICQYAIECDKPLYNVLVEGM
jgi:DDE superfamily endonuclease